MADETEKWLAVTGQWLIFAGLRWQLAKVIKSCYNIFNKLFARHVDYLAASNSQLIYSYLKSVAIVVYKMHLPSKYNAGLDKFNICVHWFSYTQNGSARTFVYTELLVHKAVTLGTNLYRLIYNLLIAIVLPTYFAVS